MIDRIIDKLLALMTHQIAGSRDAPTTHLSCIKAIMHQNHGHNCGAVCYKYAAVNMCWCVGGGVLAFRGFHTDTEALYGGRG